MIWGLTDSRLRSISGAELEGTSPVRLIYCDESGLSKERFVVVAGVIIEADSQYMPVANYLRSMIGEFIALEDQRDFSFHATDLFSGRRIYKDKDKYPLEKRIKILVHLLQIPSLFQIPIAYGYIDKEAAKMPENLRVKWTPADDVATQHAAAFSMCVISCEKFMRKYAKNHEIATLHAENNNQTRSMLRAARRCLAGETWYDMGQFMDPIAHKFLPIVRIVDEVSFHEKDDSFLLQLADVCSVLLRFAFEGRQDCGVFFDAFTGGNPQFLEGLAKKALEHGGGGDLLRFAE